MPPRRRAGVANASRMYRYIVKRLLLVIPTLLGAAALVFVLMRLIPGDICVVRLGAGRRQHRSQARSQACHAELGLDRPMLLQFFDFVWGSSRCDFGTSMWTGQAGHRGDRAALPLSLQVAIMATLIAIADRHSARHHLGAQAEHLDRLCGARVLDRRHRHAVVLARHHDRSWSSSIVSKRVFGRRGCRRSTTCRSGRTRCTT